MVSALKTKKQDSDSDSTKIRFNKNKLNQLKGSRDEMEDSGGMAFSNYRTDEVKPFVSANLNMNRSVEHSLKRTVDNKLSE